MRHIERLPEPEILVKKHQEWQRKFDEQRQAHPGCRPDSSKYGHKKIREMLDACSYHKCFYCESRLKGELKGIDHFVEVSLAPELAFKWENLYLSCSNCNDKIPHNVIPVEQVLDPCRSSDEEIQANITFEDECICSCPGSEIGLRTIQKFRLNSDSLDLKRGKKLREIMKEALDIKDEMIKSGRQHFNEDEKKVLLSFMQPDQPYSLMSKVFLRKRFSDLFE